jgi:hypothetical protein
LMAMACAGFGRRRSSLSDWSGSATTAPEPVKLIKIPYK